MLTTCFGAAAAAAVGCAGRPGRNTPPIAADVHLDLHISPLSSSFSGLMLDVLGSCYDADAYDKGKLSIAQVERPDRGTAEVIDGMLRYNASSEAGEFEDKFAYFVQDTKGAVAEDWVYITASESDCCSQSRLSLHMQLGCCFCLVWHWLYRSCTVRESSAAVAAACCAGP
jgi:hypothetical protein